MAATPDTSAEPTSQSSGPAERKPHSIMRTQLAENAPGLAAIVTGAVGWEVVGRVADAPFFPAFSSVVLRLIDMIQSGIIVRNLANSLTNFFIGFGLAVAVGVTLGLLMGAIPKVQAALGIYANALLTAPALVFAPIFFSIFGLSRWSIVALIFMYAVWLIVISTADAVRGVDRNLIEMAESFMTSRRRMFLQIMVPAALPRIMAGIRIGAGRAVKGMINGEMFIAAVGLGAAVQQSGRRFDAEGVLAVLLVILAVAIVIDRIVTAIDQRFTSWVPASGR